MKLAQVSSWSVRVAVVLGGISLSATSVQADAAAVRCSNSGGGYLTQRFSMAITDTTVDFAIARWFPVDDIAGLQIVNEIGKSVTITFPIANCSTKAGDVPNVVLFRCSTGITPIFADLLMMDGAVKHIRLPDNYGVVGYRTTKLTVSEWGDEQRYIIALDTPTSTSGVGFELTSCI